MEDEKLKNWVSKKRVVGFVFMLSLLMLFGCGEKDSADGNQSDENRETMETVVDRGEPDRSDLLYLSSIEQYEKTDWSAEWIWTKGCSEDSYVLFRKEFELRDSLDSVTAYISAVDSYILWVNGEMVVIDGSVKRGPTPYDSYYDTVEITNLQAGENVIVLQVAFNGRSGDGSIVPVITDELGDEYTQAGMIFEMQAGDTLIKSDETWYALRNDAYRNRVTAGADYPGYLQSSMLAERNVYYDASLSLGDFTSKDYDCISWEKATVISKAGDLPFGALFDSFIQPIKFYEITDFENSLEYVGETLAQDTTLVLDCPGNIQFSYYFEIEAPAGKTITMYTDTYTDKQGMPNFKDTYVSSEGTQSYENYPWRSGSKLIIEAEAGVTFTKIGYRESEYNGDKIGNFTSSNTDLNQLWQESLNTISICMRDTYMDCPDRERGPYMGDASNEIDAALYGYDESGYEITKKAILACIGWTTENQAIPSRAPSLKPQEIPNQSLAFMTSAYHYWLHTGDAETMKAYYEAMANYLQLFEMKDGLPVYRKGSWIWNDWGEKIDTNLLQVGFYYYALNLTSQLASDLGIDKDQEFLTDRMTEIKNNFRSAYYTEDGFKSEGSKYIDDRANAMLALSGLADEEDYPIITSVLMTTYEASPFCEKYVLEALCMMDEEELAVQRMLDRYVGMLYDDYDTLWEQFTDEIGTVNHGWTSAPLYILSKYVAGIRSTQAGFEAYEIAPTDFLDQYACTVYTLKGNLVVSYEKGETQSILKVHSIASDGIVIIPETMGSELTITGGEYEILEGNRIHITDETDYQIIVQ